MTFQVSKMDLTTFLAQLVSFLREIEGSHKEGNMFFNFWALLLKMYLFEVATFLSCLVLIQSAQFFSGNTCLWDSSFWWSIFPHNYQNAYDHQTFQGGDMLQGALTHTDAWHLNGKVLWGQVTNKLHISTCRRWTDTTLGKMLT